MATRVLNIPYADCTVEAPRVFDGEVKTCYSHLVAKPYNNELLWFINVNREKRRFSDLPTTCFVQPYGGEYVVVFGSAPTFENTPVELDNG